jgi:hypothetical protein
MNEMQAYSIVNAGAPNKFNASDTAAGGEYMPSVPRQQKKAASDDDFADIFGGSWQPSSRFAAKSEQKANSPETKVDDLFTGSIEAMAAFAEKKQKEAEIMQAYAERNGSWDDRGEKLLNEWRKNNPIKW